MSITRQFLQRIFPKAFPCLAIDSTFVASFLKASWENASMKHCYTSGRIEYKESFFKGIKKNVSQYNKRKESLSDRFSKPLRLGVSKDTTASSDWK